MVKLGQFLLRHSSRFLQCSRHSSTHSKVVGEYRVTPSYGTLRVTANINTVIVPDMEHMCGSVCTVRLLSPSDSPSSDSPVSVSQSQDSSVIDVCANATSQAQCCHISLPVKYDVTATLRDGAALTIKSLQNTRNDITSDNGPVNLEKLQSLHVNFSTDCGALLIKGKLLSSLLYRGNSLHLDGSTLQADDVTVTAMDQVKATLESLHSNTFNLKAKKAEVTIGNLTSLSTIEAEEADILMNNCSGVIQWTVTRGSVKVGVPELGGASSVEIEEGACVIACNTDNSYKVGVEAPLIFTHPHVAPLLNEGGALKVRVRQGKAALVPYRWPSSDFSFTE